MRLGIELIFSRRFLFYLFPSLNYYAVAVLHQYVHEDKYRRSPPASVAVGQEVVVVPIGGDDDACMLNLARASRATTSWLATCDHTARHPLRLSLTCGKAQALVSSGGLRPGE